MKRDLTEGLESTINGAGFLKGPGEALQKLLNKLFQETPLRPLKLLLNGAFLEHPLHPVLTDIPIGAWTAALVIDIAYLFFGFKNSPLAAGLGFASGLAIGLGVLAALLTIVTGLMDYMDTDPTEATIAFTHGVINIIATVFFAYSFYIRRKDGFDIGLEDFVYAAIGYLLVTFGGFLGGTLVYRLGTMVNRNAFRKEPADFVSAVNLSELPEGQPKRIYVKDTPVLFIRRGQKITALGAVCSHYGGPLEEGKLDLAKETITCPWHYSTFKLEDGRYTNGPTTAPVPSYETRIQGNQVQVKLKQ